METRSRTRYLLRGAAVLAALGALTVPATAGAAVKAPVIKKVTPKSLNVGEKLIIRGKYFRVGKGRNRVLFRGNNGKSLFVRAGLSTTKRMTVVVPSKLGKLLRKRGGVAVATRFRLRVFTRRLSKRYTSTKNSPLIGPKKPKVLTPPPPAPDGDCDGDGLVNSVDTDDDNDLLPDTIEVTYGLNPCNQDSDGDGVSDGFEFQSALDLNDDDYQHPNGTVPYPGKRPYPNPRDGSDADTDFDGDGLTLGVEYRLWRYSVAHNGEPNTLTPLSYSDGLKYSKYTRDGNEQRIPALHAAGYAQWTKFTTWADSHGYGEVRLPDSPGTLRPLTDFDRDGSPDPVFFDTHGEYRDWTGPDSYLSDDERDEDGDGLSNYQETIGPMQGQSWWNTFYPGEKPFTPHAWPGTQVDDPDSDGDGILDGADDQDHDDYPNIVEESREQIAGFATPTRDNSKATLNLADDSGATTLKLTAKIAGAGGNGLAVTVTAPADNSTRTLIIYENDQEVERSGALADRAAVKAWLSASQYVDVADGPGTDLPVPTTAAPLATHDPTQADLDLLNPPLPSYGRVQPFNPCLPYTHSRGCPTYSPKDSWAPFDGSLNYLIVQ